MIKRAIIIVIDGFGVGNAPDAEKYGDAGSNTLEGIYNNAKLDLPNLRRLGLFNIDGLKIDKEKQDKNDIIGSYGRQIEQSDGKNSPIGHWEMSGFIKHPAFNTYPNGFPKELIEEFKEKTGIKEILCNEVGSGTELLKKYGEQHLKTRYPIIYTSADSVFQIAAHEDIIKVPDLYKICEIARTIVDNPKYNIGTIIARPFIGTNNNNFERTYNRKDFESPTFGRTMLDVIKEAGKEVIAIGKIDDLFSGRGITEAIKTQGNTDGIEKTIEKIRENTEGLIFTNLVDFDMLYGHRNNIKGYAQALEFFDNKLEKIENEMKDTDILIITGDHGNDPSTPSTDHSREMTPVIIYGKTLKKGINLGTRNTFADISATILDELNLSKLENGKSFKQEIED